MTTTNILIYLLIALPLLGALIITRLDRKRIEFQRHLAIGFFSLEALLAVVLLVTSGYYRCGLYPGEGNCLWDAAAVLSLFVASLFLAQYSNYDPQAPDALEKALERIQLLAMTGAWALLALAMNFLMFLGGINLFFLFFMR